MSRDQAVAEKLPAHRREDVERKALQGLQRRRREDRAGEERNQDRRNDVPSPNPPHRSVADRYSSRSRRPMIGVGEAVALASTSKV